MAGKVDALGWHLQFYAPGYVVRDLIDFLRGVETPFVIDHMGYMLSSEGLTAADFERLLALMTEGQCTLEASAVRIVSPRKRATRRWPMWPRRSSAESEACHLGFGLAAYSAFRAQRGSC